MNTPKTLASTAALWMLTSALPAQTQTRGELLERLDAIVEESMERLQVPGTSVAIQKDGELILARGYGLADVENRVAATEHTVYRIGSVSKQFAAATIMQLVDQGRVALDEPAATYLPDYPWGEFRTTVRQLLDHTSGIKGYTEMPVFWEEGRNDLSHERMIEIMSEPPLEFEPGDRFQYSNSAYYLAGLVVENVTGTTWPEFVQNEVFRPLGMRSSHYLYNDPIVPNRAEGYRVEDGVLLNDAPLSMHLPFSAGALGSSVSDLIRWVNALTSGEVVTELSTRAMTTRGKLNDGSDNGYGLGLFIGELSGHKKIEHGGGINGFLSQLSWYPDDDLIVAVLTNSTSASPAALEAALAREVLGLPQPNHETISLTQEELERYAGLYDMGRNEVPFTVVDGALQFAGTPLLPLGNHRFVSSTDPDRVLIFEFGQETAEHPTGFRLERWGQVQRGVRIPSG